MMYQKFVAYINLLYRNFNFVKQDSTMLKVNLQKIKCINGLCL